jgi:ribonuclease Z
VKLDFIGTGAAMTKQHLHTAFFVETGSSKMLVDTLGGYDIVRQLRSHGMGIGDLRTLFVSHRHTDHALGFVWLARLIWQAATLDAGLPQDYRLRALCSPALGNILARGTKSFIPDYYAVAQEYIDFIELVDGGAITFDAGITLTPIDLQSTKAEQFGFILRAEERMLAFTGDERVVPERFEKARGCDLLVSQAACLHADEVRVRAHERHQGTVRETAETATALGAKALLLTHIGDEGTGRRERFIAEASQHFSGRIEVPEDGETVEV